jgi:hypothetical protein
MAVIAALLAAVIFGAAVLFCYAMYLTSGAESERRRYQGNPRDRMSMSCPRCKGTSVRRSKRKGLEKALIVVRPFRCKDCHHRFFRRYSIPDERESTVQRDPKSRILPTASPLQGC